MNEPINPEPQNEPPYPDETPPVLEAAPCSQAKIDWLHWVRRLLVCNPFFLCSAALLLFGVNRLSLDPNFLGEEQANLVFNYGALQLYGFLVVGTALILARRKIWYDSALLVVVEHGLVLVPFMLISQGALIHLKLGMTLAAGAVAMVLFRMLAIHRWYPQFNLPLRMFALGLGVLLINASLALAYPRAVVLDTDDWATPNLWLWYAALPAIVACANLLPKPTRYGGLNPERHWLPLFIYALWTTGTGAHLWCLGHISNLPFQIQFLGPAAVVAAWTMYRRIEDCVPAASPRWRVAFLVLAFALPLLSFGNSDLFEAMVLFNATAFAALFLRNAGHTRIIARELLILSVPFAAIGMPEEIARVVIPHFVRAKAVLFALSLLVFICALRWFRVRLALVGAVAISVIVMLLWPAAPVHAFIQVAMLFVLAHSLAWRKETAGATFLRFVVGVLWFVNAAAWVHNYSWRTDVSVTASALILLGAWFAIWRAGRERPDLVVASMAGAVSLCAPTDWLVRHGSPGLIALAASVFLFAIGFTVAWTRHRWERSHVQE